MVHQTWTDDQISFLQEGSIGVIPRYTTMFFVMATTMFFVMALNENNSISVETSGDDTENSLKIKAPISDRNLLVHLCGNYPNRYLSYEPCPESPHKDDDGSKCRKGGLALGIECIHSIDCPLYADYRTECSDKGHCCTVSERTGYVWESCDNGGYFISSPCKTKTDCEKNLAMLQGKRQPRWEKFEQTCHRGECCTVAAAKDGKTNEEIPHPPAVDDGEGRDDLEEGYNDDHKRKKTCKSRGGYELAQNCVGNRDCNRILGLRLEEREQIECVAHRCCVSPRRLPKGMSNLKACPDGGHFLGKFCHKSDGDCAESGEVCQRRRYCCSDDLGGDGQQPIMEFDDVIRGSTDGCNRPEDQLTKLRCYSDSECTIITNGYCNSEGYCCRRGGAGVCPNGARWLGEYCNRDGDCLRVVNRAGIVRCFIGLCCTARGRQKVESEDDESPRISPAEGDLDSFAYCYNGQRSRTRCSTDQQCYPEETCVNELCCRRTGEEWKNACGGAMAVSSCLSNKFCSDQLTCTASNFCCECQYGQAVSRCTKGCPPGYECENGYCCPKCRLGGVPFGSCYNTQCAKGYSCTIGNICCSI